MLAPRPVCFRHTVKSDSEDVLWSVEDGGSTTGVSSGRGSSGLSSIAISPEVVRSEVFSSSSVETSCGSGLGVLADVVGSVVNGSLRPAICT